jgi:hypothetical protein
MRRAAHRPRPEPGGVCRAVTDANRDGALVNETGFVRNIVAV